MRAATLFVILNSFACIAHAQSPISPTDTNRAKATRDTTLPTTSLSSHLWRALQAQRNGGDLYVTDEAMRYYASPTTIPNLLEATGGAFPLILSDEAYGRESFMMTQRTSEALTSTSLDGVLPINSILSGASLVSYFPLDGFSDIRMNSAAEGQLLLGGDYAASDAASMRIERFRAPVPYSRIHYTQDLTRSFSDFDGLFSLNPSQPTNLTFALHRRASGHSTFNNIAFNPRADLWSARAQAGITKYLGTIPNDTTWTQHKTDSLLATPEAKKHTLDLLVWGQYTTAFSGLGGGVYSRDSSDIFNEQLAPAIDSSSYDHRIRMDAVAELELPLLAEARTKIAGFASYESRKILSRNRNVVPFFVNEGSTGSREGLSLIQPLDFNIGEFLTHATVRGDLNVVEKGAQYTFIQPMKDTRLSATASDSLALRTAFRASLFGFVKTTESNLTLTGSPASSLVLPSAGLSGSIGLTNALSFTASYNYAKDRAALSPSPNETYEIQNLGGWFDLRVPLSRSDSIALHAGFLDRHEPEGVVYDIASDSAFPHPRFSSRDLHAQSINANVDAYFSHFHFAANGTYFPSTTPLTSYTQFTALQSDLPSRIFGFAGLYFENEVGEGNLRLVVGPRVRTLSTVSPQLTYDPYSDYYVYRGLPPHYQQDTTGLNVFSGPLKDSRITSAKYLIDVILSAEVDRRAQINMSLLNILSAPYYDVAVYPRSGFHWRLDVTWAFLD